ncbi:hypothetical protein TIFTF001_025793 [Ficus carica]|uniref:Uncharacterized protein n=1 Tax=Ficus carica TaxID=3494 RepID=A0AA88DEI1_FICCA|nr:hypothetical protein TIFTF001_025793 [Ficus carica]
MGIEVGAGPVGYSASTGKALRSGRRKAFRKRDQPKRRHTSPTSQGRRADALFRVSSGWQDRSSTPHLGASSYAKHAA